jgi:hypothetical protein
LLAAVGIDVDYFLTGDLDPYRPADGEQTLLRLYSGLSDDGQARALHLIHALTETDVRAGKNKRIRTRPESDL